jgi:hypothetical protein
LKIEAFLQDIKLFLMKRQAFLFLIPIILFATFSSSSAMGDTQGSQPKVSITITYANDTSTGYTVLADSHQPYTLSQKYSWPKDSLSRYNLQAYSVDNGPTVPITRAPDGNFTLDVTTDSNHSVLFFASPQFQIIIHGTDNATFFPESPTGDNWFDAETDVQFIVPYVIPTDNQYTRQQLDGWSVDSSDINDIPRLESGSFKSSVIHMSGTQAVYLDYKIQYYIQVISSFGRALGTGWYNSGDIVNVSAIPGNDMIANHVFVGWQGSVIGSQDQLSVETLADSPKVLVAIWSVDYANVSMIIIIIIAILVLIAIYQKRKKPSKM